MKIFCSCGINFIEIPGDNLAPTFKFTCRECAAKVAKIARPVRQTRQAGPAITAEAYLPKARTVAKKFAKKYDLPLEDCISVARLAVLEVKDKTFSAGEFSTVARRSLSRFVERERAERGILRKGEKWAERVVSLDEQIETDEGDMISRWETLVDNEAINPEDLAAEKERKRLVSQAVRELNDLHRKVAYLLFEQGLTVRQAAQVLSLSKSEVSRVSKTITAAIQKKVWDKNQKSPIGISRDLSREPKGPHAVRIPDEQAA